VHVTNFTFKMNQTFSRADLQTLPAKHRAEMVANIVNNQVHEILSLARNGSTSYLFKSFTHDRNSGVKYQFTPTTEELVEGFKTKFPGCSVEYTETWEEVRPGVKEQRRGIKIDWS
jgi:hypothetical protein